MNKWMKQGLLGFALTAAAVSAERPAQSQKEAQPQFKNAVTIDALDFAGGSKLKDRRCSQASRELEIIIVQNLG